MKSKVVGNMITKDWMVILRGGGGAKRTIFSFRTHSFPNLPLHETAPFDHNLKLNSSTA